MSDADLWPLHPCVERCMTPEKDGDTHTHIHPEGCGKREILCLRGRRGSEGGTEGKRESWWGGKNHQIVKPIINICQKTIFQPVLTCQSCKQTNICFDMFVVLWDLACVCRIHAKNQSSVSVRKEDFSALVFQEGKCTNTLTTEAYVVCSSLLCNQNHFCWTGMLLSILKSRAG